MMSYGYPNQHNSANSCYFLLLVCFLYLGVTVCEHILAAWNEFDQRVIDSAVKWHTHLYLYVKAKVRHFDHRLP